MTILTKFITFVKKEKLFDPSAKVLLAVSGGMDSMVMLHLFQKAGFNVAVAHCNFALREPECDGDEYFVKEMSEGKGLDFFSRRFDTAEHARVQKISIQMAARELRYDFFEEIAARYGFDHIATAHHADDAIETFFINLFRGTGISGLKGISTKQGKLIRPLLFASRSEIEAYAKEHTIRFRNDSSNDEDKYLRNKIRHNLIPALREIEPSFAGIMKGNMDRMQQAHLLVERVVNEQAEKLLKKKGGRISLSFDQLRQLEPEELFLYKILSAYGFNEEQAASIRRTIGKQAGKTFLSNTHRLVMDRTQLLIVPLKKEMPAKEYFIENGTQFIDSPLHLSMEVKPTQAINELPANPMIACIDAEKLTFPLCIRKWKKGDVFHPLGARGKKKLSDFFTDHKFSRLDKEACWILCSGDDIVWLMGHRIDHRYRITDKTKKMMIFTLQ